MTLALLNDQLSYKLEHVGFEFNMNIMASHPPSRVCGSIPTHVESQNPLWTFKSINGDQIFKFAKRVFGPRTSCHTKL